MSSLPCASAALVRRTIVHRRLAAAVAGRNDPATTTRSFAAAAPSNESLVKTALNGLHKELGGDMVPFAGYELPVLYKGDNGGVMKEHLWCRSEGKSSLFDVSHMGQVRS
jgi:aminomethyltransferase